MRVSLLHARAKARSLVSGTMLLPAVAACAGGDLLLPEDPDDHAPAQLRAVSGDGQSAVAGTAVPHPLVVEALDRAGRPVEGVVILFEFVDPPDGAGIAPAVPETDPEGRASVEVRLGRPAGEQPVDASLEHSDSVLRVRFQLTAIPSNNGGGGGGDGDDPLPDDGGNGGGGNGGNGGDDGGGHHGKGKGNGGGAGGNNGGGNDDGDED
ncbi:MAG TPA: hypothetical protein VFT28_02590 [Gemmatimonadales bacterium]|nr:hypothetical protein [Gemmatimonadales bacterium]